jgi:hypothetical protein
MCRPHRPRSRTSGQHHTLVTTARFVRSAVMCLFATMPALATDI